MPDNPSAKTHALSWDSPAINLVAVTKSDLTEYDPPLRYLWVGGAGDVAIVADGDSSGQIFTLAAGEFLFDWIAIKQVLSTGTTASGFIGGR